MNHSMFQRSPRFARSIIPLEDALLDVLRFRALSDTKKVLHKRYGESATRGAALSNECRLLLQKFLKIDPEFPSVPTLRVDSDEFEVRDRAEAQLQTFCRDLAKCFEHPFVGTITDWGKKSCKFTFSEFDSKRGIFNRKIDVIRHEHELVGMRIYKNPASIEVPHKARQIINSLNLLKPYCRIVTGTLVSKGQQVSSQITERTALGKLWDGTKNTAKSVTASLSTAVSSVPVALSDPAIVIGNKVLFAWE